MLRRLIFGLFVLLPLKAMAVEADLYCFVPGAVPAFQPCNSANPGYTSSFDSGPVFAVATPANSSHAGGVSVGGLMSIAIARTNGGSGGITNLIWKSTGGFTGSYVIRVWSKNPTNTTCTDNTNFAGSDTDDAYLIAAPVTITPSAPGSTTGDSATYATLINLTWDYKNADGSQNVYLCSVTTGTDTADENKQVRATLSGWQN